LKQSHENGQHIDKGGKIVSQKLSKEYIKNSLEQYTEENDEPFWKANYRNDQKSFETKSDIWQQFLDILNSEFLRLLDYEKTDGQEIIKMGYNIFSTDLEKYLSVEKFEKTDDLTVAVKNFADNLLNIYQFSKYFAVEKSKKWDTSVDIDGNFYNVFKDEFYHDTFETIIQPYNLLRNYLTKKPWESIKKWKLNFENSTLSDGWDKNKESANASVIFKKDNKYFLGLMKKGYTNIFTDKNKKFFDGDDYQKMVYKLLPGANKMLPKVFFSAKGLGKFRPSDKILEIRNCSSHTKSGEPQKGFQKKEFNIGDCHLMIDFFKKSLQIHEDWRNFNFNFSDTSEYKDISGFYRDVERGGYKISWEGVSEDYIKEKNENGELYLFQIKNKDWNEESAGIKNLHTLYFESLFSENNKNNNFIFKINGQAEIFYRPKSIEAVATTRNFKREIVDKKRYTKDKIFFHLPTTMNRGTEKPNSFTYNQRINEFLSENKDINIIGVDRGEKHLAYYSVVNQEGQILKDENNNSVSGSLNIINGVDYHYLLEKKANEREQQRKDWKSVQGIKDLKKGYISQVVNKLANLAVKYNAIIVFEDLNMRFKQIRGGIEKSVYQQLEKALIDKLNFMVDKKELDSNKAGHLMKAYQLTAPVEAFKDMDKQTGILFYTTASYTSKIDPVTGWRPNVYFKKGNANINKQNISKLESIVFDAQNNRFQISYDLRDIIISDKAKYPSKTKWTVCSNVERWRGFRSEATNNQWDHKQYPASGDGSITQKMKELFAKYDIDISSGGILEQIIELETKGNEAFFSDFLFYFQLICQIRNTDGKLDKKIRGLKSDNKYDLMDSETRKMVYDADFISSPVEAENGEMFDSRNTEQNKVKGLPENGDDNGAFNIARKGIITLQRITQWANMDEDEKRKKGKPNLFITNSEWDDWVVQK